MVFALLVLDCIAFSFVIFFVSYFFYMPRSIPKHGEQRKGKVARYKGPMF